MTDGAADRRRIAVVGAGTAIGTWVREALAAQRVSGSRVDLYGQTRGEAVLSEYAGEARLIQDPEPADVSDHDVIFLCEAGDAAVRIRRDCDPGKLVIDLENDQGVLPLLQSSVHAGCYAAPHPITLALTRLLQPLEQTCGVASATAVVLRPASDYGEDGVDELRQQTVRLLNFVESPKRVFGRQLAFNLIPHHLMPGGEFELEAGIGRQVGQLIGWSEPRLSLCLVTAPVFFGHAVCLHFRPRRETDVTDVQLGIGAVPDDARRDDLWETPVEATANDEGCVASVAADGHGGFWVWAVVSEAGAAAAVHAVDAAGL